MPNNVRQQSELIDRCILVVSRHKALSGRDASMYLEYCRRVLFLPPTPSTQRNSILGVREKAQMQRLFITKRQIIEGPADLGGLPTFSSSGLHTTPDAGVTALVFTLTDELTSPKPSGNK